MSRDLLSRLRAKTDQHVLRHGPTCTACALPPETMKAVRQLVAEGKPISVVARTLSAEGLATVKPFTLQKHFRDHEQQSR